MADLPATIAKLIIAGEQAGFSIDQMIQLLETGMTVETLFNLIEIRITGRAAVPRSSRWVM